MTDQEARQILARLAATFPGQEVSEDALVLWLESLMPLPFPAALAAANLARRELHRWPSHAWFLEVVRAEMRRNPERPTNALPAAPASPEVAKQYLAEIRQTMAKCRGPLAGSLRRSIPTGSAS